MKSEIILGGGCFWDLQYLFSEVKGILKTCAGYMGGEIPNPTHDMVLSGKTDYVEVVHMTYNPDQIPLSEIIEFFFMIHNPTTPDRQGPDYGRQYRSSIFYQTLDDLKKIRKKIIKFCPYFDDPIVTKVQKATQFWPAGEKAGKV